MKSLIKKMTILTALAILAFSITGCDTNSNVHEHTFSEEWTSDETNHWHAATCEHTDEVSALAEHTFGEWTEVTAATEEDKGSKERKCSVCGYIESESIPKLEHKHTFGEWKITKEATIDAEGSKERVCSTCNQKETETIDKLPHTHTFATNWSSNSTDHWYAATCNHNTEKSEKAAHSFNGIACSVCGYMKGLLFSSTDSFKLSALSKAWNNSIEYSTDGTTWNAWDGTEITSAQNESTYYIYLRGNNTYLSKSTADNEYTQFKIEAAGLVDCSGNILSLLNYDNPSSAELTVFAFYSLFEDCSNLKTAPDLPSTTLGWDCYSRMFMDCSALTTAPALPATTLADSCYRTMFSGCTSLTATPELPATTLADSCYEYMFSSCTALETTSTLPATTLADFCYAYMFNGCKKLTTAPALPAVTLTESCYKYMFQNCKLLSAAPVLSATTLAESCYYGMFNACDALATAPALPATTLAKDCYNTMFAKCTALTEAPALPATTLTKGCYNAMFKGCTALTAAPALPATTLADSCYSSMFYECKKLTTAPASLPATSLVKNCYYEMFKYCEKLTTPPVISATTLAEGCYLSMFSGCTVLKVRDNNTTGGTAFLTLPANISDNEVERMFANTGETQNYLIGGKTYFYY